MRTLKLTLAYDGTDFAGWQRQTGRRTLQGTLEKVLTQIAGAKVTAEGSGRTDAGVHALGQVASFQTECQLECAVFERALNAELPDDMLVLDVVEVRDGFHARFDAIGKRYRYVIHNGPRRDLFARRYGWHVHHRLDADRMQAAAQALAGTHDFRSFETAWPNRETSVRTISDISVVRGAGGGGDAISLSPLSPCGRGAGGEGENSAAIESTADHIVLEVAANGFLYNMVRTIVGTLVEVGRGAQEIDWPAQVLAAQDRRAAGRTAPPQGLFLLRVDYPDDPPVHREP